MLLSRRATAVTFTALLALSPLAATTALAASDAVDDAYSTNEDTQLTVSAADLNGLLANDTADHPNATLCVTGFHTDTLQGTVDSGGDSDGSFTYTPPVDFNGATTFTYDVAAVVAGLCPVGTVEDTATVTITVNPVNDPPTANPDSFSALANRTLNVAAPGVLGNDGDVDGDSLSAVKVNSPAHGAVTLAADGGFSYTPANGYVGPDAFSYRASDGQATSPTRAVSLTVSAVPPPPTPTPAPTPTAVPPTASPEPSPTESPLPSESSLPSPSPLETGVLASPSPAPSLQPGPAAGESSLPIVALGALALILGLLGVAAVAYLWNQRGGDDDDDIAVGDDGDDQVGYEGEGPAGPADGNED